MNCISSISKYCIPPGGAVDCAIFALHVAGAYQFWSGKLHYNCNEHELQELAFTECLYSYEVFS